MVKADAYGLGARQVAAALHAAGCRHFFVAYLDEALAVRDVVPDAMLAVLSGLIPGTEDAYVAHDLTPVLGSLDEDRPLARPRARRRILHVDTGMSRLGLDARELAELAEDHTRLDGLTIRYVMSHLVSSEMPDDPSNRLQRERFAAGRARCCRRRRPAWPIRPASSWGRPSAPTWRGRARRFTASIRRRGGPTRCARVVRLSVRVLAVREVPAGASVGYNGTWTAARPSRIATAALGYADGFHRSLSGSRFGVF